MSTDQYDAFPLPRLHDSALVVPPPATTPGSWAGAPCAISHDGLIYLAYRLRRPIGEGRGYRNVIAASEDGVSFEPVVHVDSDRFGSESLERPALAVTADGRWRLYLSCATPGTKHWRVELLEADTVEGLADASPRIVLPGSDGTAVKDPVVRWDAGQWHLWASVHPLDLPDHTDRMTTDYATSPDGIEWQWHGTVLSGQASSWDARGVRVSSVVIADDLVWATYDGRATAAENWEEVTGLAVGRRTADGFGSLTAFDRPALRSPHPPGGLRYLDVLPLADGTFRLYYEFTREDGAHELRTELAPAGFLSAPQLAAVSA